MSDLIDYEEFDLDGEIGGDDWLSNYEGSGGNIGDALKEAGEEHEIVDYSASVEHSIGGASASVLQLGRISHMSQSEQFAMKTLLSTGSLSGVSKVDAAAAVQVFGDVIGGDVKEFARQIKAERPSAVTHIDPVTMNVTGTTPYTVNARDRATALSMLQKTSENYLVKGPGSNLAGNMEIDERQKQQDADLALALGHVRELAGHYLDPRTIGTQAEPARRLALEESITKRLLDGQGYEGSETVLGLPNETGVTGIRATQGIWANSQGTNLNRMQASGEFDDLYKQTFSADGQKTRFARDPLTGYRIPHDNVSSAQFKEMMTRTPSLKNSLFPTGNNKNTSAEDKVLSSVLQNQRYDDAMAKADFARKILRQQMPTNRDETQGQGRTTGYAENTEFDEQRNLRNEAAILGLDWAQTSNNNVDGAIQEQGKGSSQAGLHGERTYSEVDYFIEQQQEKTNPYYQTNKSFEQGSAQWLALRKGKITASTAGALLRPDGVQSAGLEFAKRRLGVWDEADAFKGNSHTLDGNRGEDKALAAFAATTSKNKGFLNGRTIGHSVFETNDDLPGFGISPDGILMEEQDPDFMGPPRATGLLELKYLSSGSMAGAARKYTPQMQMQMAVTGMPQVDFFALDKYTGKHIHEVVKADPMMQAQLIHAGKQALAQGESLTVLEIQAMEKQIMADKFKPRSTANEADVKGQQTSFQSKVKAEEERMTPFRGKYHKPQATDSSGATPAPANGSADAAEVIADATKGVSGETNNFGSRSQYNKKGIGGSSKSSFDSKLGVNKDEEEAASKEVANASKEAADSLANFAQEAKSAVGVLAELGGIVIGGNRSGMSEIRIASEAGLNASQSRGMRIAMEQGGMETGGINRTIGAAGDFVKDFNDEAKAASRYTELMEARGKSNVDSVRNIELPSIQSMQGMDSQQITAMVQGLMQGKSPEARAQLGDIFKMPDLAAYRQDVAGDKSIMDVNSTINEEGLYGTNREIQKAEQVVRATKEEAGSIEELGQASVYAGVAYGVAGSATAGYLGKKMLPKAKALMGKAPPSQVAQAAKGMSRFAKATPLALAATVAPMAIRQVADIKDDGGVADSMMDIAEFASYGAVVGSVVPGVGTALGAGIGAGIGVANEVWDWATADDPVPNADLGPVSKVGGNPNNESSNYNTVNVEVTNEISPELVRTTTNVDGDLNVDEETGLSTSNYRSYY